MNKKIKKNLFPALLILLGLIWILAVIKYFDSRKIDLIPMFLTAPAILCLISFFIDNLYFSNIYSLTLSLIDLIFLIFSLSLIQNSSNNNIIDIALITYFSPVTPILSAIFIAVYYNRYKLEAKASEATIEEQEKLYNVLQDEYPKSLDKNIILKSELKRMKKLSYTSILLGISFDKIENLYPTLVTELYNILEKGKIMLSVWDSQQNLFIIKEVAGYSRHYINKPSDNIDEWLRTIKMPVIINNVELDGRIVLKRYTNFSNALSIIASPILLENEVVAVLRAESEYPNYFEPDDLRILNYITDIASLVFESNYYYKEIERLAITDGITGLYVHKFFIEHLANEINRANKYKSPLTLIMFDIDNFKEINDNYGHQFGDKVLVLVSRVIKNEVRETDFPARYGGDEFAIILPHTDLQGAIKLGDRLFKKIKGIDLKLVSESESKKIKHNLTISMGIGLYKPGLSVEEFIELVDQKLYKAKLSGKDRIEAF